MSEYIPKKDLVIGQKYSCEARNFRYGVWNGKSFDYMREKFGDTFQDQEFHYDDGPPFGTVKPICESRPEHYISRMYV